MSAVHCLVLVVDDDELEQEFVEIALSLGPTARQYRVIGAGGAAAGLLLVLRRRPDLLVIDLEMPEMSGEELVASLRSRGVTTPIILRSASDRLETVARRLRLEWLPKPCSPETLVAAIERIAAAFENEISVEGSRSR
jgi:two-component system response regulator CiaR